MRNLARLLSFLLAFSLASSFSYADGPTYSKRIAKAWQPEVEDGVNWAGFYAGAGGSWLSGPSEATTGGSVDGFVGWQQQWSSGLVLGAEVDASKLWTDSVLLHCDEAFVRWSTSVRARVGYAYGKVLPYATVGVGFREFSIDGASEWETGLVYGAGVQYKLTQPMSVRVEYIRWELGDRTLGGHDVNLSDNVFRAGVVWSF